MAASRPEPGALGPYRAGNLRFLLSAESGFDTKHFSAFDALTDCGDDAPESTHFRVLRSQDGDGWVLHGPNCPSRHIDEPVRVIDSLVAAVNLSVLDMGTDSLHLHAAGASLDGAGAAIVGASGSGKTTLVANLAASGWSYISDEMMWLRRDPELRVHGYPKPLSVKPGARHLIELSRVGDEEPPTGAARQISPTALGFECVAAAHPRLVVLTSAEGVRSGDAPRVADVHPADAVVSMIEQTMDAQRFGAGVLDELVALSVRARCSALTVGEPRLMVDLMRKLVQQEIPDPPAVSFVDGDGAVAPSTRTAFIGERAVVRDSNSGVVFALDEPGSVVWRALLGATEPQVDLHGPVESRFCDQLRALGVIGNLDLVS